MSFIDFIKKEKILLEGHGDYLQTDSSEPFDLDNKHFLFPASNPIPYKGKKHAVYKKLHDDRTGSPVFYGVRHDNRFIPFSQELANSTHFTYKEQDSGHDSMAQGIKHLVDDVVGAKSAVEFGNKFRNLKLTLRNIFNKVNTMSDSEKSDVANEVLNHRHLKMVDPTKQNEKGGPTTQRGLNLVIVDNNGDEIPFSKTYNKGVVRGKWEPEINNEIMRLTGGKKIERKEEEESHRHIFEPAHRWNEEEHGNFLKGHSGEHHVGEDMLNNFFDKIKDNYKDNPEEQGKLDKIGKMLNSLRHNSFIGVDPDVYFKNHKDYKKKMMHILSYIVKDTADVNFELHGKTKSISPQDVARMKRIVDDFAEHIDSGELDADMLGKAFYAMSNQFENVKEPEKVKSAFINNMAKIFAAGAEVLEGKYVLLPTAKKAHLGNKVQLLSRTGTGGEVLKKPVVVVGANRVVKTGTRQGGTIGGLNSITGLLHSTDFHEQLNKGHAIAAVHATRYFLEALLTGDPKRANRMVLEGLKQKMSPELRTLISGKDPLISQMVREWSEGKGSQIEFSDKIMSRFPQEKRTQAFAKDYMADAVVDSVKDNRDKIVGQIMTNTGVNSGKFWGDITHLRKMLPEDKDRSKFVKLITDTYTQDKHTKESLKRVLDVMLNKEYKKNDLTKILELHPQDMQILSVLGMISNKVGEGAVYHQVVHDEDNKKWHSVDNYGLTDPDKQGYMNKHEGSTIAGFFSNYKVKAPKDIKDTLVDRPDRFYHVGKNTVGRTSEIQGQMSQLMNKNKNLNTRKKMTTKESVQPDYTNFHKKLRNTWTMPNSLNYYTYRNNGDSR